MELVEAGPPGHRYKRPLNGAQGHLVAECIGKYGVVDHPMPNMFVVSSLGIETNAPKALAAEALRLHNEEWGVAVQMPDLEAAGVLADPMGFLCGPDPSFPITPVVLFTKSLTEARGMLSTPSSFVLREPAGGWIETGKPVSSSSVSWGRLALGGAVITAVAYLVLRR